MPSPFPGMDPWLERPMVFPSLHNSLLIYLQAALTAALPRGYFAASANRVWVDVAARREPDVSVFGPDEVGGRDAGSVAAALTRAGLLEAAVDDLSDPIEEQYLEIRSDEGDRLVTAVEVLSLSNKRAGDTGRTSYQQKQGEYRASGVNLVEIDLLRAGPHTTAVTQPQLRAVAGRFDYHICVMVAGAPNRYFVSPIRLEDRLPTIPIPLDPDVAPVPVDVQAVFTRAYDEGGFAHMARYDRRTPEPPLSDEHRAWAENVLRAKGLVA